MMKRTTHSKKLWCRGLRARKGSACFVMLGLVLLMGASLQADILIDTTFDTGYLTPFETSGTMTWGPTDGTVLYDLGESVAKIIDPGSTLYLGYLTASFDSVTLQEGEYIEVRTSVHCPYAGGLNERIQINIGTSSGYYGFRIPPGETYAYKTTRTDGDLSEIYFSDQYTMATDAFADVAVRVYEDGTLDIYVDDVWVQSAYDPTAGGSIKTFDYIQLLSYQKVSVGEAGADKSVDYITVEHVVPEPATCALIGLGLGLTVWPRRKR